MAGGKAGGGGFLVVTPPLGRIFAAESQARFSANGVVELEEPARSSVTQKVEEP